MSEFGTGRQSLLIVDSPLLSANISFYAEVHPSMIWEGLTATLTANGAIAYSGFVQRHDFEGTGSISRTDFHKLMGLGFAQAQGATAEPVTNNDFIINFATEIGEVKPTAVGRTWYLVPFSGATDEDSNENLTIKEDQGNGNTYYQYFNSVQGRWTYIRPVETGQGLYRFEFGFQETRQLLASDEVYPQ